MYFFSNLQHYGFISDDASVKMPPNGRGFALTHTFENPIIASIRIYVKSTYFLYTTIRRIVYCFDGRWFLRSQCCAGRQAFLHGIQFSE
jgi:hypothetical protein